MATYSSILAWRTPRTEESTGSHRVEHDWMTSLSYFHTFHGFSSIQVWIWDLDCKETWVLRNWCFWTVVLEKTLEIPLDSKEIQPVNPKGNQSRIFIGRTDAEAETPVLWPPDVKNRLTLGKIEGRRRRGRQTTRWLDGITESGTFSLLEWHLGYHITFSCHVSLVPSRWWKILRLVFDDLESFEG